MANVVGLQKRHPCFCFVFIWPTAAHNITRAPLGNKQRNAFLQCRLGAVANDVFVEACVKMQAIGDIGVAGNWVCGGFVEIQGSRLGANNN